MPPMKDLTNKQFHYLTVIEKTDKRKNGSVVWLCKCKCGNFKEATTSDLNSNRVTSCGCYNKERTSEQFIDLTGQKFGKLTVINKTNKRTKNRGIIWTCQCECGNICEVSQDSLRKGTKSCGCFQKEKAKLLGKEKGLDLTDQKFGKLTVLQLIPNSKERIWLCQCDCGNKCNVPSRYLLNGHISSCGCLKKSLGEYTINQLLTQNNINFISQYHNKNCKFPDTGYYAYFDFYVNNKYIIEYDGEQHFNPSRFNGMSAINAEQQFKKIKEHDLFKNNWCKINKIPIIRIPYTHLKNITIDDLLLETSHFLVKD